MKNILLALGMIFALDSFATIEAEPEPTRPTEKEIQSNRGCFKELETQGCGDPGADIHHFRTCMNNVFPTLSKSCKKLMTDLYK
ncbi:MAG: hypothetical protein ACLGHN_11555 [Bacteriovoracia bacterium]